MPRMRYRSFGSTGWDVSELSLGIAEQGLAEYGFYGLKDSRPADRRERVALLLHAFERGVTFVDTSSGHGEAEEVLGEALAAWREPVRVATKVSCTAPEERSLGEHVRESIEASLTMLGRERIDVVQLDDATAGDIGREELVGALADAREKGKIERVGAAVRTPEDALAAVRHEAIDVVQVAFNLLDQRAARQVFPEAEARGVALLVRSALLLGVLTSERRDLPEELATLRDAADRAERWAQKNGDDLTRGALRFCIAQREVGSVLVSVRSRAELDEVLAAADAEPLHSHRLANADRLALDDEALIDSRRWPTGSTAGA